MEKNKNINSKNLAELLASKSKEGFNKKQIEKLIKDLFDLMIKNLEKDNRVRITGFGTFSSKKRHARKGVNPQNPSKKINMPEIRVAKFKTGKKLKDALKN